MTEQSKHHSKEGARNLVKINDLPFYPEKPVKLSNESNVDDSSNLEKNIREVRLSIAKNFSFLGDAFEVSRGYYHHGIAKSKQLYGNLTDEKEQTTKIAAISSAGIIGLLLSLRKGLFKKLLYTSFFSGSVAAFVYPAKAKEYSDIVCYITKNKIPPVVKEYTGVDLNEQMKNLNNSLPEVPDLSSLKKLWKNEQQNEVTSKESSKKN